MKVNNSVVVICEALDAVFDAFAENGIPDKVLGSSGLAQELCMLPPLLKAKVSINFLGLENVQVYQDCF